jgi:protocatechuate 3,4-dioxygenase beta subunit
MRHVLPLILVVLAVGCGSSPEKRTAACGRPTGAAEPVRMGPGMELRRTPQTIAAGRGKPLLVTGTVSRGPCSPAAGVTLNAWQANAKGLYGPGPRHRCCYLQATVRTDRQGRYALETIVPGGYDGGPPHIHIEVAGGEIQDVMVEGRQGRLRHDIVLPRR